MSQIDDLKESISELDENQLMALLKDVRQNRRISKKPQTVRKAQVEKSSTGIDAILDKMSDEDKQKLLEKLRGGTNGA